MMLHTSPLLRLLPLPALLALAGSPAPLYAQAPTPANVKRLVTVPLSDAPPFQKRALVIGVTDYTLAPQLHVCGNDAHEFADLLKDKMGFTDVTLMTDDPGTTGALRPTRNNLRRAVHALLAGIEPEKSEVVLFYSGHGVRYGNSDWLVPEDGDPGDIDGTCLNYSQIVEAVNTARPARTLLVTDACRSLLSGKSVAGPSGFGKGLVGQSLGPEVAELLSCQPTEVSQEGQPADFPESVFTHFLVKGLEGDPDAVDPDTKSVTFDSLKQYVQGTVSNYVRSHFNTSQIPDGRATLGRMVLASASDAAPNLLPPLDTITDQYKPNVWIFALFHNAQGAMARDGDVIRITVPAATPKFWDVQIKAGLDLVNGRAYTLRFRAKADAARPLWVYSEGPGGEGPDGKLVNPNGPPNEGVDWWVNLTPGWQTYQQTFVAKNTTDGKNIMPEFFFSKEAGTYWLSDISLVEAH